MSDMISRTVFIEVTKDSAGKVYYRPFDWALVKTALGTMAEPFLMNQRIAYDPKADEMETQMNYEEPALMMNDIQMVNDFKQNVLGEGVNGGRQLPREGR